MNHVFTEIFGFIKPVIDAHTLGISTISYLLQESGYKSYIAPYDVCEAVIDSKKINNYSLIKQWLISKHITCLGFSYRLDPKEGSEYFIYFYHQLKNDKMLFEDGGQIKQLFFAGLPEACKIINEKIDSNVLLFPGNETPIETLTKLNIPLEKFPKSLNPDNDYDKMRWDFASKIIENNSYKTISYQNHYGYDKCGKDNDNIIDRINYCKNKRSLPIIRAHVGPYNPNRIEALKEFNSWIKDLGSSKLLDVLSIGSSQLTQSNFGEDWSDLPNGGGVPINSELEYTIIREAAKPMLVRTYSGTKNVPYLAKIHERSLNICWHALSFWWFCEIDGRGYNSVYENLKQHIDTIKYIASTGKPFEPNVPHHFAFRGADDITYIISGFLAAKTAKKFGIKHLIIQNMLNTPKYTFGKQDLAKGKALLKLCRELEDGNFKVSLQTRAGLDYFSTDLDIAKIQLAAVTALMDDIEPDNPNSPEIIHVVSYSEAVSLATPSIIKESIQITLSALKEYRFAKNTGKIPNILNDKELNERFETLFYESKEAIELLEANIPNLYTAEGLFKVFKDGFFPVPYLVDHKQQYLNATQQITMFKDGGIKVVDENGNQIPTAFRYKKIIASNPL